MIDLHSHILPELDDGSQSLEESLEMAQMAVESGIKTVIATPHCIDDRRDEVIAAVNLLRTALDEFEIPLRLGVGMEIFGTEDTAEMLKNQEFFTINQSRYPLVEFDFESDGEEETEILRSIVDAGYIPLVAHPERYRYIQREPEIINKWKRMGCLFQINRGSLLGRFGQRAQRLGMELIYRRFATVVSSDAHGARSRTIWMDDVARLLKNEFSASTARTLLWDNPGRIVKDEELPSIRPDWFEIEEIE